jgi:preprotein translocase subunit SecA
MPTGETHTHEDGSVHQGPAHSEQVIPTAKPKKMMTNTPQSEVSENVNASVSKTKKLSRNDPCWCGSGKKWKKCHYPQIG